MNRRLVIPFVARWTLEESARASAGVFGYGSRARSCAAVRAVRAPMGLETSGEGRNAYVPSLWRHVLGFRGYAGREFTGELSQPAPADRPPRRQPARADPSRRFAACHSSAWRAP